MEIYNDTYCVYVHINKFNGKKYVGQTINGENPQKRWRSGSGYCYQKLFYRAIQKYGWDGFNHEIVASNLTKDEADNFEILLIDKLKTYDKNFGYNCTLGGEGMSGYHQSEESKEKYRKTMRKYLDDEDYLLRMRAAAPKRAIYQFSIEGDFIAKYESAMEAQRCTGIHNGDISKCAFGKIANKKEFIFLFEEDIDKIDERVNRYKNTKKLRKEPIVQLTLNDEFIVEWKNSAEAERNLGIAYKNINAVCRGVRNTAGGFKWIYSSDYYSKN